MKLYLYLFSLALTMLESHGQYFKAGNENFTAKMFQEVVKNNPDKSVVLSAFSVMPPLAQLSSAAVGTCHDEILNAIGFPNDNAVQQEFANMNSLLRSVKGIELSLANKVYVNQGSTLNEPFVLLSKNIFNSETQNIDFSRNDDAAREINEWVEHQTNNRIKDLIRPEELNRYTSAVLVNAIYFKANWASPFNPFSTRGANFHVSKYETTQKPTMHKTADFPYAESYDLDAKLLEMPYENYQSSLLIILPNQIDGIYYLVEKLKDSSAISRAVESMNSERVEVFIPKFKIETTTDLKKVLQHMNIEKLFEANEARLDNMLQEQSNLYVGSAVQKTFIEVDEKGTEAAVANDFNIIAGMGNDDYNPPKIFKADHPFYFALKIHGMVIFSGIFVQ